MSESTKQLVVFLGLIASGKSFLAQALAEKHQAPYFNTDVIRKQLAGIAPTEHRPEGLGKGIYSASLTRKTYDAMLKSAREILRQPAVSLVILDGSYQNEDERDLVRNTFQEWAKILFVLCSCAEEVTRNRLAQRAVDSAAVSDGRWEIYLQQKQVFQYPEELPVEQFLRLDTDAPLESLLKRLTECL